jgi:hypothetical protein
MLEDSYFTHTRCTDQESDFSFMDEHQMFGFGKKSNDDSGTSSTGEQVEDPEWVQRLKDA